MARGFTGTSSDYILLGIDKVAKLYNGASAVSFHYWYYAHDAATVIEQHLSAMSSLNKHVLSTLLNTSNVYRVGGRSQASDSFCGGGAQSPTTSAWNACGGVLDFGNNQILDYMNGNKGTTSSVGFGSTTYAHTTSTRDDDCIAAFDQNGLSRYGDGHLAEVAIWKGDIGDSAFAALNKRACPLLVRPDLLVLYWPLMGRNSPEPELRTGTAGTLTGTSYEEHPPIIYPSRVQVGLPSLPPIYVTPSPITASASVLDPGVILGPVSVTPAEAQALASVLDPDVILGSITVTPGVLVALAQALDPDAILGSTTATPDYVEAQAQALDPNVILGSTSVTPGLSESKAQAIDPDVELGSIILTPGVLEALASVQDPIVTEGSIILTPGVLEALASVQDPVVTMGSMSVTPGLLEAIASVVDPNVIITGDEVVPTLRIINLLWTFGAGLRR